MKKKALSLLLCMVMIMSFLAAAPQCAGAESDIVYSLSEDNDIQGIDDGDTFNGTTWLQQAGDPKLTIQEKDGIKIISVTERQSDWYCVDLKNLTSLPDGYKYTITVTGCTDQGVKMKLAQTKDPYRTFASHDNVGPDGNYFIERTFTYAELQAEGMIRIQSEGSTNDFTIESIVITRTPDDSGGDTPPPDGKVIDDIYITFSEDDFNRWGSSFSAGNTTHADLAWVDDFGKDDDNCSLKGIHISGPDGDYTSYNNAIRLTFDEPLAKNAIYTISYFVFVPDVAENEGKDTLTGPGIVLNNDYAGPTGVSKFPADFGTINIGEWKEVNVTTPAVGLDQPLSSIDFRFVVNTGKNHPDVWYIDNISIRQQLINVGDTTPDYMDYPPLKDVYKDYFLIGTTSGNTRMAGDKLDIITYHFNAFTPENEMKPESVQNIKDVFTFDTLDEQLDKLPGITLIGHTLAWHSQTPQWMWAAGEEDKETKAAIAKANLDTHIEEVMNRYGADLYSMDVVNEAFADGRDNDDWKLNLRDNQGWYTALGWEWIELAFLKAAEIVDNNNWGCKLYYNDYNLDNVYKARSVYNMVKDINERYANTRPNGKPLIEGIGMQGHYNQNTIPANVENSIKLFSTLPGVSISITELDITYNTGSDGFTEQLAKSQAVKYAQLFDIFKRHAAGPANEGNGRIERVTFWGTNDGDSWRFERFPLLFDRHLRAKEAFKAVLDPDKYLGEIGPPQDIPEAKSFYGTPELGVNDPVWQKATPIAVDKKPTNQAVNADATAVVKTLWDENYFYVRAEVTDAILDATSANAWEQDSVEIFFSETAHRNPAYTDGDGQYRVSFEGRESFRSSNMGDGFSSYAAKTDNGYIVEMKIPFRVIEPKEGISVSFDVQINDVSGGPSTRLLTVWSDLTANGYNTTELWGTLVLAKRSVVTPTKPGTSGTGSSSSSEIKSSTPTGDVSPKNIGNIPVRGVVTGTPKEALDNAEKAFKQNPGIVQVSQPITLAAPPEANKGLTPVSVPIPAGTDFTALVSPNGDGSFTPVPAYTDENGTVYALIDESKTLFPVAIKTDFGDVSEKQWFAEAAKTASEMGIIFGYGDKTFRPDAFVTNQQTVAMLMRAVGYNADYAKVLQTAAERGVKAASGLDNSSYTSRVATAVLVKEILASLNIDVSLEENEIAELIAPFNDLDSLSEEERLSIAVAVKYGILVGTHVGKDYSMMNPDALLTRAQIATIAVRLVNFLIEK
ncbi:MAG: endo-1,4-beta-xylanase [Acetivibrionales bacterium]|jgi:GH35 family endo-1,4-beta-xylanase